MKIPFCLPHIGDEEIQEVVSAIKSNWLSKGPKTLEFEGEFAKFVGVSHAVGLNSCTAGLHLAQLAIGIGPGDEVITSPYTFVATANTILHCGATPVFVDIDPLTLNLSPELIEQAITPRTKAIIPVHFAGYPCEMDRIVDIARHYHLSIIEDAAHAVYTRYRERNIGSIGDITCFSFYATKNLTTGEGGMVTTSDEELAARIRMLSLHGMSKNAWNRYAEKGTWYYEVEHAGYKYNMTDVQAAFGLLQLQKLEAMQQRRAQIAALYTSILSECEGVVLPYDSAEHRHAWHLYSIRIDPERLAISREAFITKLSAVGVGTSVHFIPIPHHPHYKRLGYNLHEYPQTRKVYEGTISLPLYPGLTDDQVAYVAAAVCDIASRHRK
ncbi:DegT/DnrJ/EryC1/StrS aminotransferase family protein [Brevibacillus fluminis]|uniref:DegT/DnrJ/EryC1/StrS aminotransferase family protein n=1 Tax=Brevibacillus fluminis TaxID=511487 RepID=A0A3M8DH91_9BACL|nr:DegT/DnrJ/EryC1/StrS aminotransferase family protein [Brevibacillus fluminis]RNB87376.1 DegT/DnrJ/EryC1/StrS aminotransferase family protein [Brevibacillus fluminis]